MVDDTDMFNWTTVPGESNKRVVHDNTCLLVESYLRYGYDVVLSGLILTYEEQGALASLRAKARMLGACWDFFCDAPLSVVLQRAAQRKRDVPSDLVEKWWHEARADVALVSWQVDRLDTRQPLERTVCVVSDVVDAVRQRSGRSR